MRKRLNLIIKSVIAVAFILGVGYQLLHEQDLGLIWDNFMARWNWRNAWLIGLAVVLMPVCWLFEAAKWRMLMGPVLKMNLREALRAVLGGISISLFTPNRIGEYGGRVLFVPSKYNWWAVIATLVGSFAQNLVNIAIGLAGVMIFLLFMPEVPFAFRTGLGVLVVISLCVAITIYFFMPSVGRYSQRINIPKWLRKAVESPGTARKGAYAGHLTGALGYSFSSMWCSVRSLSSCLCTSV